MKRLPHLLCGPLAIAAGLYVTGCNSSDDPNSAAPPQLLEGRQIAAPMYPARYPLPAGARLVVPVALNFDAPPLPPANPAVAPKGGRAEAISVLRRTPPVAPVDGVPPAASPAELPSRLPPTGSTSSQGSGFYDPESYSGQLAAEPLPLVAPHQGPQLEPPGVGAPRASGAAGNQEPRPNLAEQEVIDRNSAFGGVQNNLSAPPLDLPPWANVKLPPAPPQNPPRNEPPASATPQAELPQLPPAATPQVEQVPAQEKVRPPAPSSLNTWAPPSATPQLPPAPEGNLGPSAEDASSSSGVRIKPPVLDAPRSEPTPGWRPTQFPKQALESGPVLPVDVRKAMQAVSDRALGLVRQGAVLARRQAHASAEADFVEALRLVAQGLDTVQSTQRHSAALRQGLNALDEAEELLAAGPIESSAVAHLVAAHRTPVLKGVDSDKITLVSAVQQYFSYAQEQFQEAGGGEAAASLSLYSLGRLHAMIGQQSPSEQRVASAKAMAFFQSAMLVDSRNHLAANELGVLLVQYGQVHEARRILQTSLATLPTKEAWHNLAVVHQRLGEDEMAQLARREMNLLAESQPASASGAQQSVQWLAPEQFARTTPPEATPNPLQARRPTNQEVPRSKGGMRWPWQR